MKKTYYFYHPLATFQMIFVAISCLLLFFEYAKIFFAVAVGSFALVHIATYIYAYHHAGVDEESDNIYEFYKDEFRKMFFTCASVTFLGMIGSTALFLE